MGFNTYHIYEAIVPGGKPHLSFTEKKGKTTWLVIDKINSL